MAIKFCFYGTGCYDLILYAARVLKQCKMSVLLLDYSKEQSLSCAVPEVKGIENGVRDYRGIAFSKDKISFSEQNSEYDVVFLYLGEYSDYKESGDYNFIVTDCELHTVHRLASLKLKMGEDTLFTSEESNSCEKDEELSEAFKKGKLNLIILGPEAAARKNYVASCFNVPARECTAIDMDESNMECRIRCQYDTVFRFHRISEEYQDLINRICFTALGTTFNEKTYRKAYQKAERGK